MDTTLQPATRRQESPLHVIANRTSAPAQALRARAVGRLSEAGRKASLLIGGNGREHQELAIEVPTTRLRLVHVDANGVAQLKLRPCFELDGNQRVLRADAPPVYDVPPTIEDLLRDAARNHELAGRYHAQQSAARANRQEGVEEWRRHVAQEFMADPSRCALSIPSPRRGAARFERSADAWSSTRSATTVSRRPRRQRASA